jgi:hypothetical protein
VASGQWQEKGTGQEKQTAEDTEDAEGIAVFGLPAFFRVPRCLCVEVKFLCVLGGLNFPASSLAFALTRCVRTIGA